jgi:PAS domain S-box-containing protein
MNCLNKSKEELIIDLAELQQIYNSLKESYDIDNFEHNRKEEEFNILIRILEESIKHFNVESILQLALEEAIKICGLEGGTVCIVTPQNTLELAVEKNTSEATQYDLKNNQIRVGECLCGDCALKQKPLILKNREEVIKYSSREVQRGEDIRFHAAFPIISKGKSIGVLCVFTYTDKKPTERNLELIVTLTAHLSLIIENANLYLKIQSNVVELENVITNRKHIELELIKAKQKAEESEKLYRKMIENSPLGMHFYKLEDNQLIFVDANPSASKLLKVDNSEFIGKSIEEAFPVLGRTEIPFRYRKAAENGVSWITEQVNYDDKLIIGAFSVMAFQTTPGNMVAVFEDITERKKTERELNEKTDQIEAQNEEYLQINKKLNQINFALQEAKEKAEESDRLKTAFLHNISHEIRTPMNAIMGFSDLIIDPELNPEIRKKYIQTIVQSCNQLLSIITQIVDMATIEAGQEKLYEKETSLNSIFRIVFEQFRSEADRKKISLKYNTAFPNGEDIIKTDETKLIQIISNILSNSLKFTKFGSISFGYVLKDKFLEFYVKDTGIGIPKEMHKEIFERFRQVETSETREYEGAGLGLSISKAYVELLGGEIWLDSKLEEGSVFYFNIPCNIVSINARREKEVSGKNKFDHKKSITVLVAEDEDNNLKLIDQYLFGTNISVLHASNGNEAVEICKNNKQINLVLMDLKMPVMDGFEAIKIIKRLRPDLPIIAQTAYSSDSDKGKALVCGCNNFISKPFKKEELLALIHEYLVLE